MNNVNNIDCNHSQNKTQADVAKVSSDAYGTSIEATQTHMQEPNCKQKTVKNTDYSKESAPVACEKNKSVDECPIQEANYGVEAIDEIQHQVSDMGDKHLLEETLLYDVNNAIDCDNFFNSITPSSMNDILTGKLQPTCTPFIEWRKQSAFMFGFVPLSDFVMPEEGLPEGVEDCPIEMHNKIKNSGAFNYLKCKIPVKSQLRVQEWGKMLDNYWDQQLVHFLRYGFPVDFNKNTVLGTNYENHSSAIEHPFNITVYLKEELEFNAMLGPFTTCSIKGCYTSPFMTREKTGAANRRVIIDLS